MKMIYVLGVILLIVAMSGCIGTPAGCEASGGEWFVGINGERCVTRAENLELYQHGLERLQNICNKKGNDGLSMWKWENDECIRLDSSNKYNTVSRRIECMSMLGSLCCLDKKYGNNVQVNSSINMYSVEEQEECMKVIEIDCCRDAIK